MYISYRSWRVLNEKRFFDGELRVLLDFPLQNEDLIYYFKELQKLVITKNIELVEVFRRSMMWSKRQQDIAKRYLLSVESNTYFLEFLNQDSEQSAYEESMTAQINIENHKIIAIQAELSNIKDMITRIRYQVKRNI